MNLEKYITRLHTLAFWKEFTFAQNKFAPKPGNELELADNLIWFGDYACILQLKERKGETDNPEIERTWFIKKVLKKATSQVRDSLSFLSQHDQIRICNERGHWFDIRGADLTEITMLVVFIGAKSLPEDCWHTRYHISRSAGFIHILAAHDYLGILEKLRVPEDIRRYFRYREAVVPTLRDQGLAVDESDIMGAFLSDQALPAAGSREMLRQFVQDFDQFDLSPLIGNLHDHIERAEQPYDYYRIMIEFARVPRSVWREIKARFVKSVEIVRKREFTLPFRFAFPDTGCAFMISPLDPEIPQIGEEGIKMRTAGLTNLTHAAMYDTKVSKGGGILISGDGEDFQIDWGLLNIPFESDPEMDRRLADSYPFREAKEKMLYSFLFQTEGNDL